MEITSRQLLVARVGVQRLVADALARLESPPPPQDGWLDELIACRVPPEQASCWLLAARATLNRAVGVAEALLDRTDTPASTHTFLVNLLAELLATGNGRELNEERLGELLAATRNRPVDVDELVSPVAFTLAVLAVAPELRVRSVIVHG